MCVHNRGNIAYYWGLRFVSVSLHGVAAPVIKLRALIILESKLARESKA